MKAILSLLLCASTLTATARVLDPITRITTGNRAATLSTTESGSSQYSSMIIELDEENTVDELESRGVIILYQRDNLVLACVPLDEVSSLESVPSIKRAAISRVASTCLDKALPATHADAALAGQGLQQAYTGRGVTVGFSDIGFDPGHAAFSGQVAAISHIDDFTATITRATTPDEIEAYTTDNHYEGHATHVGGILVGNDSGSPYRGVARGARLVATTSELLDVGILAGVEEVIANAKQAGEPAVVNLSLGSCLGPHDGTDLFCRYLDLCADDAAILLAAGNSGDTRMSVSHIFSTAQPVMTVAIDSFNWENLKELYGILDLWCSDSSPVSIRFSVIDWEDRVLLAEGKWTELTQASDHELIIGDEEGSILNGRFEGNIICAGEVSPNNSRSNISISVALQDTEFMTEHDWARHIVILDVKANPGTRVDICAEGALGFRNNTSTFANISGTPDLSVSSLACGHNTICVGSSTTRDTTPLLSGGQRDWSNFVQTGTVSKFTSYGTLVDGRAMPHFCAPGAYVVSAYNRYVVKAEPEKADEMAAVSANDPESYYYADCGTSMATPHAAGIMAMWLEADPTLTGTELRQIAQETAHTEGVDPSDPRTGAGVIDALAGLRYILGVSGQIDKAVELVKIRRDGTRIVVEGADALNASVEAYTPGGVRVNPDALPSGPILVRVTTPEGFQTAKLQ